MGFLRRDKDMFKAKHWVKVWVLNSNSRLLQDKTILTGIRKNFSQISQVSVFATPRIVALIRLSIFCKKIVENKCTEQMERLKTSKCD